MNNVSSGNFSRRTPTPITNKFSETDENGNFITSKSFGHQISNFISNPWVKAIATVATAVALGILCGVAVAVFFSPGALIVGSVAAIVGGGVLLAKIIEKGLSILSKTEKKFESGDDGYVIKTSHSGIRSNSPPGDRSRNRNNTGIRQYDD